MLYEVITLDAAGRQTTDHRAAEILEIDPRRVAVEHNLLIVRRKTYGEVLIDEGDTVEIVNFVGGG